MRMLEDHARNCVGQLASLMKEMQRNLLDAILSARNSVGILHRQTGDILAGNASLLDRTATQAASSMEKIILPSVRSQPRGRGLGKAILCDAQFQRPERHLPVFAKIHPAEIAGRQR